MPAGGDDAVSCGVGGQLPAFGNRVIIALLSIAVPEPGAAPQIVLEGRGELHHGVDPEAERRLRNPVFPPGKHVGMQHLADGGLDKNQVFLTIIRDLMEGPGFHLDAVGLIINPGRAVQRNQGRSPENRPVLDPLFMAMLVDGPAGKDGHALDAAGLFLDHDLAIAPLPVDHGAFFRERGQLGIFMKNLLQEMGGAGPAHIHGVAGIDNQHILQPIHNNRLSRRLVQNNGTPTFIDHADTGRLVFRFLQIFQTADIVPGKTGLNTCQAIRVFQNALLNGNRRHGF